MGTLPIFNAVNYNKGRRELAADADTYAFWPLSRPILVRFSKFFFPLKAYDKGSPAKTHRDRGLGGLGASGAPDKNFVAVVWKLAENVNKISQDFCPITCFANQSDIFHTMVLRTVP